MKHATDTPPIQPWIYHGSPFEKAPAKTYGFVYQITNALTGVRYIGKKAFFYDVKRKRKRVQLESNWRTYFGSCKELTADVARFGPKAFAREILLLVPTKTAATYEETAALFQADVLRAKLPDGTPAYYNRCIGGRIFKTQ